jgi:hypothetical protein
MNALKWYANKYKIRIIYRMPGKPDQPFGGQYSSAPLEAGGIDSGSEFPKGGSKFGKGSRLRPRFGPPDDIFGVGGADVIPWGEIPWFAGCLKNTQAPGCQVAPGVGGPPPVA